MLADGILTVPQCLDERFHALQRLIDVLDGLGVGNACKALAACTKSISGDHGNLFFKQESFAELFGRKTCAADIREHIDFPGPTGAGRWPA